MHRSRFATAALVVLTGAWLSSMALAQEPDLRLSDPGDYGQGECP